MHASADGHWPLLEQPAGSEPLRLTHCQASFSPSYESAVYLPSGSLSIPRPTSRLPTVNRRASMTLPLPPPFVVSTADAALALASADESESEAVALACVEMLFAETNACYAQHVTARRTISRVTSALASNIVDAACAAVLREDRVLPASRFVHESSPRPSIADRHAARTLPCRSPEKLGGCERVNGGISSPSRDSRSSGSPEKLPRASAAGVASGSSGVATASAARSRRRVGKGDLTRSCSVGYVVLEMISRSANGLHCVALWFVLVTVGAAAASPTAVERGVLAVALPEIQQLPEEEDEKPVRTLVLCAHMTLRATGSRMGFVQDVMAWRASCLKELSGAARRASVFSKWATVARAFTPSSTSHKMSLEVEITESTPSLLQKEILSRSSSTSAASTAIRTKSNIDSFSAILDVRTHNQVSDDLFGHQQHTSRSHWSSLDSLHESHAAGSSAKLLPGTAASTSSLVKKKLKGSGAMLLNDKLSRKKNSSSSLGGGGKLWHHESRHTSSSSLGGSTMGVSNGHHAFIPERSDFNAAALPSNIQLSSGVVLTQGESLVEGPARIESPNTMSRKRFDVCTCCCMTASKSRSGLTDTRLRSTCVAISSCTRAWRPTCYSTGTTTAGWRGLCRRARARPRFTTPTLNTV